MSWNPNCRNVRRLLALWAGNDLVEAGQVEAQRHLASCPECREQWNRLQTAHATVDALRAAPVDVDSAPGSIWPAVRRQMHAIEVRPAQGTWRNGLPFGALAAACLTIMAIGTSAPAPESSGERNGLYPIDRYSRRIDASIPHLGHPGRFEQTPSRHLPEDLPYRPRVRTLLDGTDVRDL
jgi:Putative zinc-finger